MTEQQEQPIDHVRWLRRYAGKVKTAADSEKDATQKAGLYSIANKLFEAAGAFELATMRLTEENVDEMGSKRIAKLLAPGTVVRFHLANGKGIIAMVEGVGRYDIVARHADGRLLIIHKPAILYSEPGVSEDADAPRAYWSVIK